jgi:hypothetical protein
MSRFKTVFSVFFLVIFTFNVIIYYFVFDFSEIQAKAEMSQTISNLSSLEHTAQFTLPLSSLNAVSHKEIWLDGTLYDIVKTEIKNDCVVVYVLGDKKEESLVDGMKTHEEQDCDKLSSSYSSGHSAKKNVSKTPQKYFPNAAIISICHHLDTHMISCEINCFYTTILPAVQSPPPEHPLS